jgi:hypothetical protein
MYCERAREGIKRQEPNKTNASKLCPGHCRCFLGFSNQNAKSSDRSEYRLARIHALLGVRAKVLPKQR